MAEESRIGAARRKARAVRYWTGAGAGVAFVAVALLARVTHPGTSHAAGTSSGGASAGTTQQASDDDSFFSDDDGGSFSGSPSSVPQVQSGGS
jgi:hypothetical protein